MSLLLSWLVFPLVLVVLCLGCGLLLEAAASMQLPRPLVLPAGLAVVVVLAQITTATSATARATAPVVVIAALAGIALKPPWRSSWRAIRWPAAAAVAVFALYAAPIVLSGEATFAGYIKLDDTATWFAITDRVMSHGRDLSGLPVSTYYLVLKSYIGTGYPVGAFLPLGVGHELVGQDIAWLFQPYLAFLAAMICFSLYWLARTLIPSSRFAALAAFAAPLAAITYGYALWGGAKEMMAATLVALSAALAADAAREARTGRQVIPIATAAAASLSTMSAGVAVWLGPLLVGALVVAFLYQRRDVPVRQVAAFLPLAAILSVPAISAASTFVSPAAEHTLTSNDELGNLAHPLKAAQALGIWPTGDFRTNPVDSAPAYLLIAVLVFAAAVGIVLALRQRKWELPLAVGGVLVALVIVTHFGSPWVDGKAMATAAPAFVLAGMAGAGAVFSRGRRVEGAGVPRRQPRASAAAGRAAAHRQAAARHGTDPDDRLRALRRAPLPAPLRAGGRLGVPLAPDSTARGHAAAQGPVRGHRPLPAAGHHGVPDDRAAPDSRRQQAARALQADLAGPLLRSLAASRLEPAGDRPPAAWQRQRARRRARLRQRAGGGDARASGW
jgi:hypothetical protein